MRICIGSVLLFQAITLYGSAEAFFSDYGLADRDWILNSKVSYHGISKYYYSPLLFLSGEVWFAKTILVLLIFVSLLVILGFKSQLFTFIGFILF
jgi:hypothetical protein